MTQPSLRNSLMPSFTRSFVASLTLATFMTFGFNALGDDWTSWRGPNQNGKIDSAGLIDDFNPRGGKNSNVLWKNEEAGGISTPVAMNGRLYTIVRNGVDTPTDGEKVICLDAVTGKQLWQNAYNVFLSDVPAERVGWSNVTADPATNCVFALGACCLFQCIDADSGATVWSHSMSEEFGMLSTYGGRTNTPAVFEDLVIISGVATGWDATARPTHQFMAFNTKDGRLVWISGTNPLPEDTTYSTPVFTVVDGQDVMLAGSGDGGLHGFAPRTGKHLFGIPISRRGVNTSPITDDAGNAYIAHGEENPSGTLMGAVVKIDLAAALSGSQSAEMWRTEELIVGKSSPLLVDDRVYIVEDSSKLHVLNAETGEEIGDGLKLGTSMRGSLVYADQKIYACTGTGYFYVLEPSQDEGVDVVSKVRMPKGHDVGGSPVIAEGRMYVSTTGGLFCLASEDAATTATKTSNMKVDKPEVTDKTVASLQVIPAEAIVSPASNVPLEVRGFNQLGQQVPVDIEQVTFNVVGNATVKDGALQVGESPVQEGSAHSAALLTASLGEAIGKSRYRIIPPLPWTFDFSDHEVPVTWIGARYRHEAREVEGKPAIVKVTTIPKGTRSQTWFGPTELNDYTITADVQAAVGIGKLPDIGVIAQRYTLDMMGESQQLQIRTWTAQLRMARSVPFKWSAGTWYRIKFAATVEGEQAILKAKVWPRDEDEPKEWMLTATDDSPNPNGSPGLFGNSTNAEIYIENVTVQANE